MLRQNLLLKQLGCSKKEFGDLAREALKDDFRKLNNKILEQAASLAVVSLDSYIATYGEIASEYFKASTIDIIASQRDFSTQIIGSGSQSVASPAFIKIGAKTSHVRDNTSNLRQLMGMARNVVDHEIREPRDFENLSKSIPLESFKTRMNKIIEKLDIPNVVQTQYTNIILNINDFNELNQDIEYMYQKLDAIKTKYDLRHGDLFKIFRNGAILENYLYYCLARNQNIEPKKVITWKCVVPTKQLKQLWAKNKLNKLTQLQRNKMKMENINQSSPSQSSRSRFSQSSQQTIWLQPISILQSCFCTQFEGKEKKLKKIESSEESRKERNVQTKRKVTNLCSVYTCVESVESVESLRKDIDVSVEQHLFPFVSEYSHNKLSVK